MRCAMILLMLGAMPALLMPPLRAADGPRPPVAKAVATLPVPTAIRVTPASFTIRGVDNVQQLLATGTVQADAQGHIFDYTRKAVYVSSDPKVAAVTPEGVVSPRGNGRAEIRVTFAGRSAVAKVAVQDIGTEVPVSFRNQIVPIFTKLGCNSGGCHGKATGQNSFKLSLLGFDAEFDLAAITREARGRRILPSAPEFSLLLQKATGGAPHGGGIRMRPGTSEYDIMLRWIRQGTPAGSADDPRVVRVECFPKTCISDHNRGQQILVTAFYSDGSVRDVTREAQFKSNEENVAAVDGNGLVRTFESPGNTAVMARYMGQVDVCRITIPLTDASAKGKRPALPQQNYIDKLVQAKWEELNLLPSPRADDATFLRRAFLDCIGTLPTPAEVREFLADARPNKRELWIDRLLARPEYADFWAIKWGDLLRNKRRGQRENMRGTYAFHAWIRNAMSTNMPYDQFVRNILAAQGTVDQHPPVIWYRTVRNLTAQTNDTSQLFLGTRINCAQCHHHPYEKWSQDDYYQLQAFFGRLGQKSGDSPSEPAIYVRPDGQVRNVATGKIMQPRGLDGPAVEIGENEDPRQKLVDWMVAADNPFFAKAITNRLWAHFMGRGLVEPVDDMRVTNPPTNPELLDALAQDLIRHKFDLKHLLRTIMSSTAYQLSSETNANNLHDQQNYARAYPRRVIAEVLLDAVNQVAGTQESFQGLPKGTRAIQLPDESVTSYFLDVFSRPSRETACECERPREANLAQALHLLNSGEMENKIRSTSGRIGTLLKDKTADNAIIEELYLAAFTRLPTSGEMQTVLDYVREQPNKRLAFEDLLWAMFNTKEFLFNH